MPALPRTFVLSSREQQRTTQHELPLPATTGPLDEWRGSGSVNIGTVAGPALGRSSFQSNLVIRAAFGASNGVTCLNRALRADHAMQLNTKSMVALLRPLDLTR